MTKLSLEVNDDVVSALNKIRDINDNGIDLEIPEGSILFENIINFKLIKKHAEKYGLTVHFQTSDENGANLIAMMDETASGVSMADTFKDTEEITSEIKSSKKINFKIPSIDLSFIKMPKFNKNKLAVPSAAIWAIVIAVLLFGLFLWSKNNQKATAKIIVNSQPLTRSITIKVKANTTTTPASKLLNGVTITNNVDKSKEGNTTGTKIIGDKATGKAKIFNKMDTDKELKKGSILIYDNDDKDLNYVLKNAATIPAATVTENGDGTSTTTFGSQEVDIEAEVVGSSYNISTGKKLAVKSYKKAEMDAEITKEITGGKSETVKVVADADIKAIAAELTKDTSQSADAFANKISNSQKLIEGSVQATLVTQSTDHKIGDTADKVIVTQTMQIQGLTYLKGDLDRLLDTLVKEYIPEGFILSDKERQVNAEALGNSSSSVATPSEADIQVTLKTFVVPDISEDSLKKELAGKTPAEAEKILGGIRNVKTYEFKQNKSIFPFLNRVPKDTNKIEITIERQ